MAGLRFKENVFHCCYNKINAIYNFVVPFFHTLLLYLINPTYVKGMKIVTTFLINYVNYTYYNKHKSDELKM